MNLKKKSILDQSFVDFSAGSRFLMPIVMSAFVGICTGFIAVAFIKMVGACGALFFGQGAQVLGVLGPYYVIFIPAVAGLMVGPLVTFLAPEAKGHGVPEVLQAIAVKGGRTSCIRPGMKPCLPEKLLHCLFWWIQGR
ncbi:MAG: hypothetical protein V2A70_08285 [Candidatus Omnitrophota bacterium]